MPNGEHVLNPSAAVPRRALRRVSWGGVFAGMVAVLLIQFVLLIFGAAVGLLFTGAQGVNQQTLLGMGLGAGIWWLASSIIAGFFGAMIAARLSGVPNKTDGTLNGLVSWATAQLVAMLFTATALGALISGPNNILAGSMQGTAMQRGGFGVYAYVQPANAPATQPSAQIGVGQGDQQQTMQAAKVASGVAWWALITLALSGVAAAIGGSAGTPKTFLMVPGAETEFEPRT
jgi:hypothetical protein